MNTKLKNLCRVTSAGTAWVLLLLVTQVSSPMAASCSPGIPCTNYSLPANPTAGTIATLNGPKTGKPAPYTGGMCDGNFMNQIISKAYLGASREVIMSEQMIHKPDSVLAYTCFDQLLGYTSVHGGVFSESLTFGRNSNGNRRGFALKAGDDSGSSEPHDGSDENNGSITPDSGSGLVGVPPPQCDDAPCEYYYVVESDGRFRQMGTLLATGTFPSEPVQHNQRLDKLLERTVASSLYSYLNSNFNHTYLGGNSSISRPGGSIASASYNCAQMGTIWQLAGCSDFGEYDRFRNFSDLVRQDPRAFPSACSPSNIATDSDDRVDATNPPLNFSYELTQPCPAADGTNTGSTANTGITNLQIDLAHNCNYTYAHFDIYEPLTGIIKSPVVTASPSPGDTSKLLTGHPTLCSQPLPTGVLVISYTHLLTTLGPLATPAVLRFVHYDHVCPNPGCYYVPVKVPMPMVPGSPLNVLNMSSVPSVASSGVCSPL